MWGWGSGRSAGPGKCVLMYACIDAMSVACFGGFLSEVLIKAYRVVIPSGMMQPILGLLRPSDGSFFKYQLLQDYLSPFQDLLT